MEVLLTLVSDRDAQRSLCLSSHLVFSDWERIFQNPLTTVAASGRVVLHAVILDRMQVRSFRLQQATGQQTPEPAVRSGQACSFFVSRLSCWPLKRDDAQNLILCHLTRSSHQQVDSALLLRSTVLG